MKTMKRIIISMLAAAFFLPAGAQSLSLDEEHRLYLDVLRMLEAYEASATLRNNDDAATFAALFPNEETGIYNDLLGISAAHELTVSEYVTLMRSHANSPVITLRNVRKKGVEDGGDKWIVTVSFDKELRYTNKCGAILSSKGYYGKDYSMEARITRDKVTGECVIESLTGNIDSTLPRLDRNFAIVELNDPRDRKVTNNGQPINFNTFDQAFIAEPTKLEFYDDDANMKVLRPDANCNRLRFTYKPLRWRLKPHYDLTLGDYYNFGSLPTGISATSAGSEFGLDLGYIFPSKDRFKVGFFFGVGFATSKLTLTATGQNFNVNESTDVDGDSYIRQVSVSSIEQSHKIQNIVVPLYFDFEYRFHSYVSAFFRLGGKAYINMGSKSDGMSGTVTASGLYPQYGNLVIAEDYINGFGTHDLADASFIDEPAYSTASFDAFGGIGVRSKIYGPLSIEVGLNYQFGLTDAIECNINYGSNLVEYYNGVNRVKNLALELDQVKRTGLRLNVGLILKF